MTASEKQDIPHIGETDNRLLIDETDTGSRFRDAIAERFVAKPMANEQAYAHKLVIEHEWQPAPKNSLFLVARKRS